ncbi:polyketide cyclase/dehydrase/lipid transport protein [Paraburkholderia caballeronis]|uniref:SRPBCC family protein n=1 Tax=Paraburkholderia caballeronis TaxID=416943 RepID=UPI001066D9F2|nr:SRPBCC family protein [Paraburkholderia caballeronis]TDV33821.1 polyketide cyclase/dehydrase/lipid transport protein [Paraburkholderia caballeronis]
MIERSAAQTQDLERQNMTEQPVRVTIVNHVAVDIACPPGTVWRAITDEYIAAKKFREVGYAIELLNDPGSPLGGYHMRFEADGLLDERICRVTEYDEAARRLSLYADYVSEPKGNVVYATYQALPIDGGARYTIDCHSTLNVVVPADAGSAGISAHIAELDAQYEAALVAYLSSVKAKLDGAP